MEEDSYYQHRIRFRAGNELLNLKLHRSEETRTDDWLMRPLRRRIRTSYIHARPYLLAHPPVLTVALYSRPAPGGAIGEVVGSDYGEFLEQEVGNAQAWIFPEDKVLLLWECYFFRDFRTEERQLALWRTFEGWLLDQAPAEEATRPDGTRTSKKTPSGTCSTRLVMSPSGEHGSTGRPSRGRRESRPFYLHTGISADSAANPLPMPNCRQLTSRIATSAAYYHARRHAH